MPMIREGEVVSEEIIPAPEKGKRYMPSTVSTFREGNKVICLMSSAPKSYMSGGDQRTCGKVNKEEQTIRTLFEGCKNRLPFTCFFLSYSLAIDPDNAHSYRKYCSSVSFKTPFFLSLLRSLKYSYKFSSIHSKPHPSGCSTNI